MRLKKQLFKEYVHGQEILMNKRPISIILSLNAGALCWEADGNGAKLSNLFLIFKTPEHAYFILENLCCRRTFFDNINNKGFWRKSVYLKAIVIPD